MNNICDLAWLIRDNRQLLNYTRSGTCSNGTAFTNLNPLTIANCNISTTTLQPISTLTTIQQTTTISTTAQTSPKTTSGLPSPTNAPTTAAVTTTTPRSILLNCPPAAFISPCTCTLSSSIYKTSRLNCNGQQLNDSELNNVLNAFLVPGVAPLVEIDACCNQLTQIPVQITSAQFPLLATLILYSNQITSIPTGAFTSSPVASIGIDLHSNKLTAIPLGAFNLPNATSVQISLSSNQITSIPSGVFLFPNATSISINVYLNQIISVSSGIFNYPMATQISIDLANNQLTMLQPGTFQGNFEVINLDNNKLVRFDANIFQATLKGMLGYIGSYITIVKGKDNNSNLPYDN